MVPVHIAPHDTPDRCCFIKNLIFWHTHILEYIKSLKFHDKKSKDNTGLKVGQQVFVQASSGIHLSGRTFRSNK